MGRPEKWLLQHAWLGGDGLARDVLIEIEDGVVAAVTPGQERARAARLAGVALPGLVDAHSHAFHRLLRGRTQLQGGDFWAWRERMYDEAARLTPDSYEEVATAVFVEMALAGTTCVGEFHYLHHQPGGTPYDDPNEMGHALVRAARRAGIRLCLLDAAYLAGGLDGRPLNPVQERFSDGTAERWLQRVEELRRSYSGAPDVTIGLAPHSVRAVPGAQLRYIGDNRPGDLPIHIHVSEQPAENEACLAATGSTPTALLAGSSLLGERTTVVHATHVTDDDIALLGSSGTGVCYCSTTERDLADGLGPADRIHRAGSTLCVGSDSHAVIDLFEEARGVELHTRLRTGRRGLFAPAELAGIATANGARALGLPGGRIEPGAPADLCVISLDSPRTYGADATIESVIFSATASDVTDVIVAGERIVADGRHREWERVRSALRADPRR